ncbi:hypothetical protein [Limosilactobacillus ingluviei]|nr:hypothetical protein [Limosilactobacillus ingluviei]
MEKINRANKDTVIRMRVTAEARDYLKHLASNQGITLSNLMARALDDYVLRHELKTRMDNLENELAENGLAYDDDHKLSEIGLDGLVSLLKSVGVEDVDQLVRLIELAAKPDQGSRGSTVPD